MFKVNQVPCALLQRMDLIVQSLCFLLCVLGVGSSGNTGTSTTRKSFSELMACLRTLENVGTAYSDCRRMATPFLYAMAGANYLMEVLDWDEWRLPVGFKSAAVVSLLQSGISPDFRTEGGEGPLHVAAVSREAGEVLLDNGANPNLITLDGRSAKDIAFKYKKLKLFSRISSLQGLQQMCHSDLGSTLSGLDCDIYKRALANSTMVPNKGTVLHDAIQTGASLEAMVKLIKEGADVNAYHGRPGKTPLHVSASSGNFPIVAMLVSMGANLDLLTEDKEEPAVSLAEANGHQLVVDYLRDHGAKPGLCLQKYKKSDVNKLEAGLTSLHKAAQDGDLEEVETLLFCGADPNRYTENDNGGSLPIHEAAFYGFAKIVERLLEAGADPDVKKRDGWASIHLALIQQETSKLEHVLDALLEGGADVNLRTSPGAQRANMTALDLAIAVFSKGLDTICFMRYRGARRGSELDSGVEVGYQGCDSGPASGVAEALGVLTNVGLCFFLGQVSQRTGFIY